MPLVAKYGYQGQKHNSNILKTRDLGRHPDPPKDTIPECSASGPIPRVLQFLLTRSMEARPRCARSCLAAPAGGGAAPSLLPRTARSNKGHKIDLSRDSLPLSSASLRRAGAALAMAVPALARGVRALLTRPRGGPRGARPPFAAWEKPSASLRRARAASAMAAATPAHGACLPLSAGMNLRAQIWVLVLESKQKYRPTKVGEYPN